jgi:hypothetical protein
MLCACLTGCKACSFVWCVLGLAQLCSPRWVSIISMSRQSCLFLLPLPSVVAVAGQWPGGWMATVYAQVYSMCGHIGRVWEGRQRAL